MAREFFCAYHSILEAMEPLNDAECGRLFRACLNYSMTGAPQELCGNERFVFPGLKAQIDRDIKKYSDFAQKQPENGKKGGRPPKANESQKTQAFFEKPKKAKEKEKEKEKAKEKENKYNAQQKLCLEFTDDLELQQALFDWLDVRKAKRAVNTERAIQGNLNKLCELAQESGMMPLEYVQEVVRRGWQAFYPIERRQSTYQAKQQYTAEDAAAQMQRILAQEGKT